MLRFAFRRLRPGFTALEAVLVAGIIALISSVVLVGFGGLSGNIALQRGAQELALNIRRAQSFALSVRKLDTSAGAMTPRTVGAHLDTGDPVGYFLFVDRNANNTYESADDAKIIGFETAFDRGVRIESLSVTDQNGVTSNVSAMDLTYTLGLEEFSVAIRGSVSNIVSARIVLGAPGLAAKKSVEVRVTGQVSVGQ